MNNIWYPNKKEIKKIKAFASQEAGRPCHIEIAKRINLDTYNTNVNIALISDDPDWDDTDLQGLNDCDTVFKYGIELNKNGKAIIDFYLYDIKTEELISNLTVIYLNNKIISVYGTSKGEMLT